MRPGEVKAIKAEPMYAKSHARVVPAEVWSRTLADIQSTDGSSPNLLALVSGDLADSYAAITAKEADIADIKAQIATEKDAKDAKDATDEDKKTHDKNIDDLKKKVSKLEDEVDPLRTKFLASAKDAAQKAPPAARERRGAGPRESAPGGGRREHRRRGRGGSLPARPQVPTGLGHGGRAGPRRRHRRGADRAPADHERLQARREARRDGREADPQRARA